MKSLILFVAMLALVPLDAAARCGPSRFMTRGISKPEVITLNAIGRGVRDGPALYLRIGASAFGPVLLFKPDDVVATLEKQGGVFNAADLKTSKNETQKFLDAVKRDLPLEANTDLFKYGLQDSNFAVRLDYLVADLLKAGQVAIDNYPYHVDGAVNGNDQYDEQTVTMVWKGGEDAVWFCTASGRDVLTVYYVIY